MRVIQVAKSIAGHDKDKYYVIDHIDGEYVYLINGKNRTFSSPKKKNRKHLEMYEYIWEDFAGVENEKLSDANVIRIIKCLNQKNNL